MKIFLKIFTVCFLPFLVNQANAQTENPCPFFKQNQIGAINTELDYDSKKNVYLKAECLIAYRVYINEGQGDVDKIEIFPSGENVRLLLRKDFKLENSTEKNFEKRLDKLIELIPNYVLEFYFNDKYEITTVNTYSTYEALNLHYKYDDVVQAAASAAEAAKTPSTKKSNKK